MIPDPRTSEISADSSTGEELYLQEVTNTVYTDMQDLDDAFQELQTTSADSEELKRDIASYWREVEKGISILEMEIDEVEEDKKAKKSLSQYELAVYQDLELIETRFDRFLEQIDGYSQVREYKQELSAEQENAWENLDE